MPISGRGSAPATSEFVPPPKNAETRRNLLVFSKTYFALAVAILACIYVALHLSALRREFVFEEPVYVVPGMRLFQGLSFVMRWGYLYPDANPFHKPPLTSIVLGVAAKLLPDPVAGARLLPIGAGLFLCLVPAIATGALLPAIVTIISPYLYASSCYIQTDPTLVLAASVIVSWAVYRIAISEPAPWMFWMLGSGIALAWNAKTESGALLAGSLIAATAFFGPHIRKKFLLSTICGSAAGFALLTATVWWLSPRAGISRESAFTELFSTIARITGHQLDRHRIEVTTGSSDRLAILRNLHTYQGEYIFYTLLAILALSTWRAGWKAVRVRETGPLWCLFVVPLLTILYVAYSGGSFTRYFIISAPPAMFLIGYYARRYSPAGLRFSVVAALFLMVASGPLLLSLVRSPGSPSVIRGSYGVREAASVIRSSTKKGSFVIGPDILEFYVPDQHVIVFESFDPYPDGYQRIESLMPGLSAIVLPIDVWEAKHNPVLDRAIADLKRRGGFWQTWGTYRTLVVATPEVSARVLRFQSPDRTSACPRFLVHPDREAA